MLDKNVVRTEYKDAFGTVVVHSSVDERDGYTKFEITRSTSTGYVSSVQEVQMRYVGDANPQAALQVNIRTTRWKMSFAGEKPKERSRTTYESFSLPADVVATWVMPMFDPLLFVVDKWAAQIAAEAAYKELVAERDNLRQQLAEALASYASEMSSDDATWSADYHLRDLQGDCDVK